MSPWLGLSCALQRRLEGWEKLRIAPRSRDLDSAQFSSTVGIFYLEDFSWGDINKHLLVHREHWQQTKVWVSEPTSPLGLFSGNGRRITYRHLGDSTQACQKAHSGLVDSSGKLQSWSHLLNMQQHVKRLMDRRLPSPAQFLLLIKPCEPQASAC